MSGLAGLLAGHDAPGVYRWQGTSDAVDVRHTVEHAGWGFGAVDGWTSAGTMDGFRAAVGETLGCPDYYGQNFDALSDCLHDIGAGTAGVVLLWDGWSTLARADAKAFSIALSVLGSRVNADRGVPFAVLMRGEGPEVAGLPSLD